MAKLKFWRTLTRNKRRKSRSAPQLPEFTGMAQSARRMNRLIAAVTIFGACGTVALAIALTPGAQTSTSGARAAAQGALAVGQMKPEPIQIEKVSLPATVTAALPEPVLEAAPKADRLVPAPVARQAWVPNEPRMVDLRGSLADERPEEPAEAAEGPDYLTRIAPEPKLVPDSEPDEERGVELALSEPPAPGAPSEEAANGPLVEDIEDAIEEASEEVVEEAVEAPAEAPAEDPETVEEPAPEQVAVARTAVVKSDVNLRAGPDNGAAVIMVVRRNRNVELIGCDYWCEVVYEGRRGFIYKSFVRRTDS